MPPKITGGNRVRNCFHNLINISTEYLLLIKYKLGSNQIKTKQKNQFMCPRRLQDHRSVKNCISDLNRGTDKIP